MTQKVPTKIKYVRKPPLSVDQILAWAKAHHEDTGRWPHAKSGTIAKATGENWAQLNKALRNGYRGFPGGSSLSALLGEHFGIRRRRSLPALTIKQVLAWMREHHRLTGQWPNTTSGAVQSAPSENWRTIDNALRYGNRSLAAGFSLRLLRQQQGWK